MAKRTFLSFIFIVNELLYKNRKSVSFNCPFLKSRPYLQSQWFLGPMKTSRQDLTVKVRVTTSIKVYRRLRGREYLSREFVILSPIPFSVYPSTKTTHFRKVQWKGRTVCCERGYMVTGFIRVLSVHQRS